MQNVWRIISLKDSICKELAQYVKDHSLGLSYQHLDNNKDIGTLVAHRITCNTFPDEYIKLVSLNEKTLEIKIHNTTNVRAIDAWAYHEPAANKNILLEEIYNPKYLLKVDLTGLKDSILPLNLEEICKEVIKIETPEDIIKAMLGSTYDYYCKLFDNFTCSLKDLIK